MLMQKTNYTIYHITAKPTATKFPPSEYMAQHGQTIIIECAAIGVPPPLIVWRLNWGHIGAAPRITTETERVSDGRGATTSHGILTIRKASKEDEGAYTCEALNTVGNIFVVPDTIVHVIGNSLSNN